MQMFIFSWNQGEFFSHIHFPETCEGSKDTPGQETNSGGNSAFFQLNEHSVGEASLVRQKWVHKRRHSLSHFAALFLWININDFSVHFFLLPRFSLQVNETRHPGNEEWTRRRSEGLLLNSTGLIVSLTRWSNDAVGVYIFYCNDNPIDCYFDLMYTLNIWIYLFLWSYLQLICCCRAFQTKLS